MDSNESDPIAIERDGSVLSVRLNRESKKNAITLAMYARLADVLHDAARDVSVHVVLLSGASSIFSAGNDIQDFMRSPPV